jgi:hypothetical protein
MTQKNLSARASKLLKPCLLCLPLIMLSACGVPERSGAAAQEKEGRAETRNIRNTESIGYSGDAISNKIDSVLDANEDRLKSLDKAEANQY